MVFEASILLLKSRYLLIIFYVSPNTELQRKRGKRRVSITYLIFLHDSKNSARVRKILLSKRAFSILCGKKEGNSSFLPFQRPLSKVGCMYKCTCRHFSEKNLTLHTLCDVLKEEVHIACFQEISLK